MFERGADVVPRCGWSPEEPKLDTGLTAPRIPCHACGPTRARAITAASLSAVIHGSEPSVARGQDHAARVGPSRALKVTCPRCRQTARITAAPISSSC